LRKCSRAEKQSDSETSITRDRQGVFVDIAVPNIGIELDVTLDQYLTCGVFVYQYKLQLTTNIQNSGHTEVKSSVSKIL